MSYDKTYFPYPSTDTIKILFIIKNQGKKVRFGAPTAAPNIMYKAVMNVPV